MIGLSLLVLGLLALTQVERLGQQLAALVGVGLAVSAARFLCAPLMAAIGERELASRNIPVFTAVEDQLAERGIA